MIECEAIARAALGEPVKKSGGELFWHCPWHDDRHPSFSVNPKKQVWACFVCGESGTAWQLASKFANCAPDDKSSVLRWLECKGLILPKSPSTPSAIYTYQDQAGHPLYRIKRCDNGKKKSFIVERYEGGCWQTGLGGTPPVLYHLPKLIESETVYVTEGEKCADALAKHGLTATTNCFGAGRWRKEYNPFFKNKQVFILPDNDEVGKKHSQEVAKNLYGIAAEVKIVELEGLPPKGDIVDFFNAGGTVDQLAQIVSVTPVYTPKEKEGLPLISLAELYAKPIEEDVSWLLEGILPQGGISLLVGKPKTGKSTLARGLALAVATGRTFLSRKTRKGAVIYLLLEERLGSARRHFQHLGASGQENIFLFHGRAPSNAMQEIARSVAKLKPALVCVDTLFRWLSLKPGAGDDYTAMTNALNPILTLAQSSGAHFLLLHHAPKSHREDAIDMPLGSTALAGSVDTVLLLQKKGGARTLQSAGQRDGEPLEETILVFNEKTRSLEIGESREKTEDQNIRAEILGLFDLQPCYTRKELLGAMGRNTSRVLKVLKTLCSEGSVLARGTGRRSDPFRYEKAIPVFPPKGGNGIEKTARGVARVSTILFPEGGNGMERKNVTHKPKHPSTPLEGGTSASNESVSFKRVDESNEGGTGEGKRHYSPPIIEELDPLEYPEGFPHTEAEWNAFDAGVSMSEAEDARLRALSHSDWKSPHLKN